jgi:hypothetical protein
MNGIARAPGDDEGVDTAGSLAYKHVTDVIVSSRM